MVKGFIFIISVLFSISLVAQQTNFEGLDRLSVSNAKKGIKYYQRKLKKGSNAKHEYYLSAAYYLRALSNSKNQMEYIQKAEEHLKNIETDQSLKFQYNFRMGLCKSFYNDYDAALPYFSKCVSMYPMHIQSNCFRAISMAYHLEKTDTSHFFDIVDDLNALILVTSDTSTLENLGKALLCLKNSIEYPVMDQASRIKLKGLIDLDISIFPIEFIGGMYDLDSTNFTTNPANTYQDKGYVYEIKQDSNLLAELVESRLLNKPLVNNTPTTDGCSELIRKLDRTTSLSSLLCLPKGSIVDEYSLTTFKNIRLIITTDSGRIYDDKSLSMIEVASDKLSNEAIEAIQSATHLDQLYFEIDYKDEGIGPKTVSIRIGL
ncbi:MAG: tetratricopeptide (TPR) repeat protein [Parvicellaceae bacterium]|jgi:tetratricopeptide (TPR) repeat protein